jgi:hypothetical protein
MYAGGNINMKSKLATTLEAEQTFTIAVQVNGASLSASQYVNYQTPLPGNDTVTLTIGMTLNAGDVISVQTPSTTVSFNIFGSEIS